jgi:hypothetical protein
VKEREKGKGIGRIGIGMKRANRRDEKGIQMKGEEETEGRMF